jgi:hypothetical protein
MPFFTPPIFISSMSVPREKCFTFAALFIIVSIGKSINASKADVEVTSPSTI